MTSEAASCAGPSAAGAVLSDGSCPASALALLAEQRALVKTVKNGDWLDLVRRLGEATPFRTSFSLPPPDARGMTLFGRRSDGCTGLIADLSRIDASTALVWPSGYNAKTEHNLVVRGSGGKQEMNLLHGREEALVSLDALRAANVALTYRTASGELRTVNRDEGESLPYNEVNVPVSGADVVVGVFVRSMEVEHVLFALGVRALLEHAFPALGPLPLLHISAAGGAVSVPLATQLELIRARAAAQPLARLLDSSGDAAGAAEPSEAGGKRTTDGPLSYHEPRLPVDAARYRLCALGDISRPGLSAAELVAFHGAHGLSGRSLRKLFDEADAESTVDAAAHVCGLVLLGLTAAVGTDNVSSAREVVRASAAQLLGLSGPAPPSAHPYPVSVCALEAGGTDAPTTALGAPANVGDLGPTEEPVRALVSRMLGSELSALCGQARESPEMLVALGAQIALGEFVVGRTSERLHAACDRLAAWLQQADSIVFRVQSWHELRNDESSADEPPDLRAYLGGHAVRNRRRFHSQLTELAAAADGEAYTRALVDIEVLGLDASFSRDVVVGVVALAHDIVAGMAECHVAGSVTAAVDRVSLDEATRLEAEAVYGVDTGRAAADPLGEQRRKSRALIDTRH